MFKSKTKYTWEGWDSSGREDWVFNVKHPCELIGVHAKLIDNQLREGEKIEYCIYAPRISSTSTPFGFKSEESSCGVCMTDNRFIVTKNRHIKDIAPSLTSIDFKDIIYFNIGSALLLSWVSIAYVQDGKLQQMPILFGSNGRHHFEKALRAYKKYCLGLNTEEFNYGTFSASGFIHKISDNIHRSHLRTLISQNERCILTFSCQYLWHKVTENKSLFRKSRESYVASKATVLFTNKALLIARDGLGTSVGNCANALNIPLDKVSSLFLLEEKENDNAIHKLRINFIKEKDPLDISLMSLDEKAEIFLNNIQSLLGDTKQKEEQR
jgi:hypothetical protein